MALELFKTVNAIFDGDPAVEAGRQPGETIYYYFRVIQRDGNMAWSSPVWVRWI